LDPLVATLLTWIVARTGLAAPDVVPHTVVEQSPIAKTESVQAFYRRVTATIYLPETWRPDGLRNQSILLHELVHHVQFFNSVRMPCDRALERQAYDLQVKWLREQGVTDPYKLIGTDEFTVIIFSMCPISDE
jgi:Domain of unknown function (DUF6647)